jgi:hypothetical protein
MVLANLSLSAQVSEVKYSVEYNESTAFFDCYLHIIKGSTRAGMHVDRVQFNAQFSLVSHAGVDIEIIERFNPLIDNIDNNGTEPNGWQIFNRLKSPDEAPGLNFYSISPKLAPTSHYNDLFEGDKVKIFSVKSAPIDTCTYKLRMFDNTIDTIIGTTNGDYRNGFSVGGIMQLYSGNVDDSFVGGESIELQLGGSSFCRNTSVSIQPVDDLTFKSTNKDVAYFDENILNLVGPGDFYIYALDKTTKCNSDLSDLQTVVDVPQVNFVGSDNIDVGQTTMVSPTTGGTWYSSNSNVATISNGGLIEGIQSGNSILTFSDNITGCISEGLMLTVNMPTNLIDIDTEIEIYPSPSYGYFRINGIDESIDLEVYGVDFKRISVDVINDEIDLTTYPDGIYIVKLKSNSINTTKRIIKSTH